MSNPVDVLLLPDPGVVLEVLNSANVLEVLKPALVLEVFDPVGVLWLDGLVNKVLLLNLSV